MISCFYHWALVAHRCVFSAHSSSTTALVLREAVGRCCYLIQQRLACMHRNGAASFTLSVGHMCGRRRWTLCCKFRIHSMSQCLLQYSRGLPLLYILILTRRVEKETRQKIPLRISPFRFALVELLVWRCVVACLSYILYFYYSASVCASGISVYRFM